MNARALNLMFLLLVLVIAIESSLFALALPSNGGDGDLGRILKIAHGWQSGENPLRNEKYFIKSAPYAPLYPATIAAVSALLGLPLITVIKFFQAILPPFVLISTFYFVRKMTGIYEAALASWLLASTYIFWRISLELHPQLLDMALFPLAILAFLNNRSGAFVLLGSIMVYVHAPFSLLLLLSLLIFSLFNERKMLREFAIIALLSLPLAATTYEYLPRRIVESGAPLGERLVVTQYFATILEIMNPLLLFFSTFGLAHVLKKKDKFGFLLIIWVLSLVPLYAVLPIRLYSYLIQPLAILGSVGVAAFVKTERVKTAILALITAAALVFHGNIILLYYSIVKYFGAFWPESG